MKFGNLLAFLILVSALALGTAKAAEIILKVPPCKLCYYQRYIYGLLIFLCSIFFIGRFHILKLVIVLTLLISSSVLSFYHMGIEQKWFAYESECTTTFKKASTFLEYKKMLKNKDIVTCDQSLFEFLGISIAAWNFIYTTLILLITLIISMKFNWFKDEETKTPSTP
ncbi:disulfide bond formation protein [endosymbiont of Acanthamoeba sp. UWC8]|uniref:disulfide bond formation protein B n=1 Tax=endosymbiont of Acanthamoeba sp. UWC8 TaxID=86106 RepID=UPI0004D0BC4B|nr:disulfide bond formation protein B [endosymbiont of Acanthamoeba sp. UWC8]AIF80657.1 disulfide bond formation protein [endosymbiont of Acanthamoeba sp. UWC8]